MPIKMILSLSYQHYKIHLRLLSLKLFVINMDILLMSQLLDSLTLKEGVPHPCMTLANEISNVQIVMLYIG